jgi:hypothetical protein
MDADGGLSRGPLSGLRAKPAAGIEPAVGFCYPKALNGSSIEQQFY